mgnify:CR=1 FL=1
MEPRALAEQRAGDRTARRRGQGCGDRGAGDRGAGMRRAARSRAAKARPEYEEPRAGERRGGRDLTVRCRGMAAGARRRPRTEELDVGATPDDGAWGVDEEATVGRGTMTGGGEVASAGEATGR